VIKCCGEETEIHIIPMNPIGVIERSKTIWFCKACGKIVQETINRYVDVELNINIPMENE
jgi:hypothetical protein